MTAIRRIYERFRDLDETRRLQLLTGCAILIALVLIYTLAQNRVKRLELRRASRETEAGEMLILKQRYRDASATVANSAGLLASVRSGDTVAGLIEAIGIKGGGVQIKPLGPGEKATVSSGESAEVKIDRLTVNEAVNLLYRLEQGGWPVTVSRALIKTRFDDPARVDITLTVTLHKPAARR